MNYIYTLIFAIIGLFLIYIIVAFYYYFNQDKILYKPTKIIFSTPKTMGIEYDDIFLTSPDGVRINCWYIPYKKSDKVLLFCHGNYGNLSHRLESIRIFRKLGINIILFDYRGFGRSEGKPYEEGTYIDAESVWNYLVENLNYDPDNITILGRSLGGAVALEVAIRKGRGKLIVESSFTSIFDMAKSRLPLFAIKPLINNRYDSYGKIDRVKIPTMVIHSRDDSVVPFEHGIKLYRKLKTDKRFLEIYGDHSDNYILSEEIYIRELKNFIYS